MVTGLEVPPIARRFVASPRAVATTVLVVYGLWIACILILHGSPYAFVSPGRHYLQVATRNGVQLPSLPSRYGFTSANPSTYGQDGQFTYYIALHPISAKSLLDVPAYRYQRVLEPLVVAAISLGNQTVIPWLLIAVSWMAVVVGTWAIASWLSEMGRQPGWSLLYGLWPGLIVTVRNDLTDGVAYGLVAVAILLVASPSRPRPVAAAVVMGLAVFARQEVAIYAAMMAIGIGAGVFDQHADSAPPAARYRLVGALRFAAVALGPFCIYLAFLAYWLKAVPSHIFLPQSVPAPEKTIDILLLVVPAIVGLCAFIPKKLTQHPTGAWAWWTYCVHVVALTGFMVIGRISGTYYSWSFSTGFRYYIPIALGALLCYGYIEQTTRARSMVLVLCGGASMAAVPVLMGVGL
jgi:hypothetical protein